MKDVFIRNWYRRDSNGRIVPGAGRKTYIARSVTEAEAQQICERYNSTHNPGRLSRKAEYWEAGN
jgi:hypothetical protein